MQNETIEQVDTELSTMASVPASLLQQVMGQDQWVWECFSTGTEKSEHLAAAFGTARIMPLLRTLAIVDNTVTLAFYQNMIQKDADSTPAAAFEHLVTKMGLGFRVRSASGERTQATSFTGLSKVIPNVASVSKSLASMRVSSKDCDIVTFAFTYQSTDIDDAPLCDSRRKTEGFDHDTQWVAFQYAAMGLQSALANDPALGQKQKEFDWKVAQKKRLDNAAAAKAEMLRKRVAKSKSKAKAQKQSRKKNR